MVSASRLRAQWSQLFAPADRTLPAMLTRQAERFAQKPLVTAGGTTWTYADTYEAAARCAGALRSAGIQPGRVLGNRARLRLARSYCCSNQRRVARTAASAHLVELRRAAIGHGSGLCGKSDSPASARIGHRGHLADRSHNGRPYRKGRFHLAAAG